MMTYSLEINRDLMTYSLEIDRDLRTYSLAIDRDLINIGGQINILAFNESFGGEVCNSLVMPLSVERVSNVVVPSTTSQEFCRVRPYLAKRSANLLVAQ